jgi:hypothetical protein
VQLHIELVLAVKQVKDQNRYTLLDYRLSVEGAIA